MKGLLLKKFVSDEVATTDPYTYSSSIPVPSSTSLKPHEVLIKVAVAGYCHTEKMTAVGDFKAMLKGRELPLVPSHEPTGIVVALGSEASSEKSAPATGGKGPLQVGDRVGSLAFKDFCGECPDCKSGRPKYCDASEAVGLSVDGGFAEYCVVDYRSSVKLPDNLDFASAAPLMCAGATMASAIKGCNLQAGQHLAIIGAGALGHIGCSLAKAQGLKVSMIDSREPPLELCRKLRYAPDHAFNAKDISDPSDGEQIQRVIDAIGGSAPDATIVATDVIPAFTLGVWLTKKHGQLQVVGQPSDPIQIPFFPLIFRDLRVTGSLLADQVTLKELVDLVAEKGIEVRTREYGLQEVPKLLSDYAKPGHAGKLVVRISTDKEA